MRGGEVTEKLVDATTLRDTIWDESSSPSLRTIQQWTLLGVIPSVQVGRLRFYYVSEVREHLERRNKVRARSNGTAYRS